MLKITDDIGKNRTAMRINKREDYKR